MNKGARNRKRRQHRQAKRAERRADGEARASEARRLAGPREPRRVFAYRIRGWKNPLVFDFRSAIQLPFAVGVDEPDGLRGRLNALRRVEKQAPPSNSSLSH